MMLWNVLYLWRQQDFEWVFTRYCDDSEAKIANSVIERIEYNMRI